MKTIKLTLLLITTSIIYSCSNSNSNPVTQPHPKQVTPIIIAKSIGKEVSKDDIQSSLSYSELKEDFFEIDLMCTSTGEFVTDKVVKKPEMFKPFYSESDFIVDADKKQMRFKDAAQLLKLFSDAGYDIKTSTVVDKCTTTYIFEKKK